MVHDTYDSCSTIHDPFTVERTASTYPDSDPFGKVWGVPSYKDGDVLDVLSNGVKIVFRDMNHGLYPVVERPGYLIDPGPPSIRVRPVPQKPKPKPKPKPKDKQLEFDFMGGWIHAVAWDYVINTPEGLIEVRIDDGRFEVLAPRGRLNSSRGVLTTSTWKRYD